MQKCYILSLQFISNFLFVITKTEKWSVCWAHTLMMLYRLKTPPALPPSRCSLMVLCSWGGNKEAQDNQNDHIMQIFLRLKWEMCGIKHANEMRFPYIVKVNHIRCDECSSLDSISIRGPRDEAFSLGFLTGTPGVFFFFRKKWHPASTSTKHFTL